MQENQSSGFPTWSDTNQPAQSQKMARILKFWINEEELYYLSSENKGADQLYNYCTADLRLCFYIGKIFFFLDVAHFMYISQHYKMLMILC